MKKSQPILLSIPVLLIALGHIYYFTQTQDGCWTAGQSLYLMFSYIFGGVFAFAASIISIVWYTKERQVVQLLPLLASVLLVVAFILNSRQGFRYNEDTQAFQMQTPETEIDVFLFLNSNGECLLYTRTSGVNCYFTGRYEVRQDTLRLQDVVVNQKEGAIFPAYLLGQDSVLRPLSGAGMMTDSTTWLVKKNLEALN